MPAPAPTDDVADALRSTECTLVVDALSAFASPVPRRALMSAAVAPPPPPRTCDARIDCSATRDEWKDANDAASELYASCAEAAPADADPLKDAPGWKKPGGAGSAAKPGGSMYVTGIPSGPTPTTYMGGAFEARNWAGKGSTGARAPSIAADATPPPTPPCPAVDHPSADADSGAAAASVVVVSTYRDGTGAAAAAAAEEIAAARAASTAAAARLRLPRGSAPVAAAAPLLPPELPRLDGRPAPPTPPARLAWRWSAELAARLAGRISCKYGDGAAAPHSPLGWPRRPRGATSDEDTRTADCGRDLRCCCSWAARGEKSVLRAGDASRAAPPLELTSRSRRADIGRMGTKAAAAADPRRPEAKADRRSIHSF